MKKLLILLLIIPVLFSCDEVNKSMENEKEQAYLIILSLDGFRWDYTENANTPTFDSLAKQGVRAESLKPSFPTKTFPNHYSIATGLYPDHHGIVLNRFYATDLGKNYSISKRETIIDGDFYGGTPMWNVAESQGMKSATLFWVGASADVNGMHSSHWSLYDEELSKSGRIDSISKWLNYEDNERPQLIMWYYHEPDATGHHFGPNSQERINMVEEMDAFLNDFFIEMRKLPIFDNLNFIITSDHGMAQLSPEKVIILDEVVDTSDFKFWDGSNPVINFKVKDGRIDKVLNDLELNKGHLLFWERNKIPEELHYGHNIRTHDITVTVDSGWSIYWSWKQGNSLGTHGYPNTCKDMHAIFYAAGPAFKNDYIQQTFNNVDIYPLVGEILDLKMPDSDGEIENTKGMLKGN